MGRSRSTKRSSTCISRWASEVGAAIGAVMSLKLRGRVIGRECASHCKHARNKLIEPIELLSLLDDILLLEVQED